MQRLVLAYPLSIVTALAALFPAVRASAQETVDLELVLAIDVSRSVDADEAALQRQGYVSAFRNPEVQQAMVAGPNRRIAVAYVEWAGSVQQLTMDWTKIDGPAAAEKFAAELDAKPIISLSRTSVSGAIDFSAAQFGRIYKGQRQVIDISGDGPNNAGRLVVDARDEAVAKGIQINGLPIINDRGYGLFNIPDLDKYYENCVIGGPNAFVIVANGFQDFAQAIRRKLVLEMAGLPPPRASRPWLIPAAAAAEPQPSPCDVGERQWQRYMGNGG